MYMIITILFYILIFIMTFFLETFFSVFGGFGIVVAFLLFFYKKVDWKIIFVITFIFSLCLDVVGHYVLGTSLLIFGIVLLFYYLLVIIFPEQDNLLGLLPFFMSFVVYYLMKFLLPTFLLFGSFGSIQGRDLWGVLFRSLLSAGLIFLFGILYDLFRGNKVNSGIVLK